MAWVLGARTLHLSQAARSVAGAMSADGPLVLSEPLATAPAADGPRQRRGMIHR